jgi:hypothetical protein
MGMPGDWFNRLNSFSTAGKVVLKILLTILMTRYVIWRSQP